jgi:hypothetical protein
MSNLIIIIQILMMLELGILRQHITGNPKIETQ